MQREPLRGEGCLSSLPILKICEFHDGIFSKKNRTSKAMVMRIAMHLGECPPSDKVVGCEHGTQAVRMRFPLLLAKYQCCSIDGGVLWWVAVKEQTTRID
jgi:hypothetical protein